MTQPRSQQIKSVNARYSVLRYSVNPSASSTNIPAVDFPYAPGGAADACPARAKGSALAPFPILGGDTFSVGLDGAPPVNVVLSATDTTAGRIAVKVNAALGAAIASNDAGHLLLASTTSGPGSSLRLSDVSPGVLSKLGLLPGTVTGQGANTDGLVTFSPDGLGGVAPLATLDGKNLVTDGGKLVYLSHVDTGVGRRLVQLTPGGVPVVGLLTALGSDIVVSYHARMIPRRVVRSSGSYFSQLGGGDGVTPVANITVNGQGITLHFPNTVGTYTRDGVVDLINSAWHSQVNFGGISDPWARADGTISGPFPGLNGSILCIEVDGGPAQAVSFIDSETTLDEVIATINSNITGVTAFKTPNGSTGPYLAIRSNNSNGLTSSLRIYPGGEVNGDENSAKALFILGLRAGLYGGSYVCQPYGPDEIEIFSAYRGQGVGVPSGVSVSGNAGTLAKLGLSSVSLPGLAEPEYVPVPAPSMTANETIAQQYGLLMAYPAVLEFGDVPGDADIAIQQYAAKSAGSNVYDTNRVVYVHQDGKIDAATTSRGFFDVGKPVVMSPEGALSADVGGVSQSQLEALASEVETEADLFQQIVRVQPSDVVQAVVGTIFETTGNGSNPRTPYPFMSLYSDPTNGFPDRGFRLYNDPGALAFSVEDDTAQALPAKAYSASVHQGRSLYWTQSEGRIADQNTVDSGDADGWVRLTSAVYQEKYLSVGGSPAVNDAGGYNLMRSVNARYEVYLGDGTSSFGDFSGANALSKARAWLVSNGVTKCKIVFKPGTYTETAAVSFTGFTDVAIEAAHVAGGVPSSVTVNFNTSSDCISATGNLSTFRLKNVKIVHSDAAYQALNVVAFDVDVEGCSFNTSVSITDAKSARVHKCVNTTSTASGLGGISVRLRYTDAVTEGAPYVKAFVSITQCQMKSGANKPVVKVTDALTLKQVQFRKFLIEDCVMTTGNLTVTSFVINSTDGVGILGITPTHNAFADVSLFASRYAPGLLFEELVLRSIDVIAGTVATGPGTGPAGIYLTPSGVNGVLAYSYYDTTSAGWSADLRNVILENVTVDCVPLESVPGTPSTGQFYSSGVLVPPVVLAGIGIPPYRYGAYGSNEFRGGSLKVDNLFLKMNVAPGGFGPPNLAPFLGSYLSSTADTDDSFSAGHIVLAGQSMDLRSIFVDGSLGVGLSTVLFLATYGRLSLDGYTEAPVAISSSPTGNQGMPLYRLVVREVFTSVMDIKNVYLEGTFGSASLTAGWWQVACVQFEAMDVLYTHRKFSNFEIAGFRFGSSTASAIHLTSAGIDRSPYIGECGGITIEDGYIGMYGSGIPTCFVGITAESFTGEKVGNLTIRNVAIDSCPSHGIAVYANNQNQNIVIDKCDIRLCGNSQVASGLYVVATRQDYSGNTIVRDNFIGYCNTFAGSSYDRVQANIRNTNGFPNLVTFYGNSSFNGDFGLGFVNVTYTGSASLFTISPAGTSIAPKGVETGYSGQTGSYTTTGAAKVWTDGVGMQHNMCYLRSSTINAE